MSRYDIVLSALSIDHSDASINGSIAKALQTLEPSGGKILLKQGDYSISSSVVLPDNITIKGQRGTRIVAVTDMVGHMFASASSIDRTQQGIQGVHLEQLSFIGQRNVRKNCIDFSASDKRRGASIRLLDISVEECGRHGIHIKGADIVVLDRITAKNNGQDLNHDHNIYLLRDSTVHVADVYTTGAAGNGLSSTLMKEAEISHVHSEYNGRRGIRFGAGRDIVLSDCTVNNNGLSEQEHGDGIIIVSDDYGHSSADITIDSCSITANQRYGLTVHGASNIQVKNSVLADNGKQNLFQKKSIVTIEE